MLSTLTPPLHTALTTLEAVKEALKITYSDDDAFLTRLIRRASAACVDYCNRPFARATYRETVPWRPSGLLVSDRLPLSAYLHVHTEVLLRHTPVGHIDEVLVQDAAVTDYVLDPDTGILGGLPGGDLQVDYTAGYLLPSDDYTAQTISAASSDNSLNDTVAGFPLLVPGDVVTLSGFDNTGNNRRATIVTATESTLVLSGLTLTTENGADPITLTVSTLPEAVEAACLETVSAWYLARQFDLTGPRLVQTGAGTAVVQSRMRGALPQTACELLAPWVRIV